MMIFGGVALGLLILGWLVISFSQPTPRRVVIEWLSSAAMYTVLCTIFANLILRAHAGGNTVALVAFGLLGGMFTMGLLVTLFRALAAMGGAGQAGTSATN